MTKLKSILNYSTILAVLWAFWVLLEYLFHHSYYGHSIARIPYLGLFIGLCIFNGGAIIAIQRFPKIKLRGWMIYAFGLLLMGIIVGSFGLRQELFNEGLLYHVGSFMVQSVAYHLGLLLILFVFAAYGYLVINRLNIVRNASEKNLLSVTLGLSLWGFLLVVLGLFGALNFWVVGLTMIIPLVVQYKPILSFLQSLFWKPIILKNKTWTVLTPIFLLVNIIAINAIGAMKLFPIGNDATKIYQHLSHQVAALGYLPKGGQSFNGSVLMSVGEVIFQSPTFSMLMAHSMGILVIWSLYHLARLWVSRDKAWLAALLFYIMPATTFHLSKDAKVDLLFLFVTLSTLLFVLQFYRKTKKTTPLTLNPFLLWTTVGWLLGFGFGVKYLAFFSAIALIGVLLFQKGGWQYTVGSWLLALSALFGLGIYQFGYVPLGGSEALIIAIIALIGGLFLFIFKIPSFTIQPIRDLPFKEVGLLAIGFLLAFLPWMVKNGLEHSTISFSHLIEGKAEQQDFKKSFRQLHKQNIAIEFSEKKREKHLQLLHHLQAKENLQLPENVDSLSDRELLSIKISNLKQQKKAFKATISTKNKSKKTKADVQSELIRYLGYEQGLPLYLSLPYDLTMNTNIHGRRYLDIGFLFLLLFPIWFLGNSKTVVQKVLAFVLAIFLLLVSWHSLKLGDDAISFYREYQPAGFDAFFGGLYAFLMGSFIKIGQAFSPIFNGLSQFSFSMTLVSLLAISGLAAYLFKHKWATLSSSWHHLILFVLGYGIFWIILGNGVPWYAFPVLSVLPIFIVYWLSKPEEWLGQERVTFSKYFLNIAIGFFLLLNVFALFTNYDNRTESWDELFQRPFIEYFSSPDISKRDALASYNPKFFEAIDVLNQNKDSKIYRVGTFFNYHIENSQERVFSDDYLNTFANITKKLIVDEDFFIVLKNNGFEYILYDLNTAAFDQTDEKVLGQRVSAIEALLKVGRLEVIATDNIIVAPQQNNQQMGQYGWGSQTVALGSFILFRIL